MSERYADAVVVAAGASRRMGGIDKLAADLGGRPLLARSVEAMAAARSVRRVIVVAAAERVATLAAVPWLRDLAAQVVAGGEHRSDSVLAGVRATSAELVLIHDGARPLASPRLADAVAAAAAEHGAAVPVLPVADALKRADGGRITGAIAREGVVRAQTPQAARRQLLLDAFAAAGGAVFADEAALLEAAGVRVATVPGEAFNLKVTQPDDLQLARSVLARREGTPPSRIGLGSDSHPFGPEDGLWLAGVELPDAPRLHGHSDGDVALHALATAILSACGRGDLGRLFPQTDPSTAGAASAGLLGAVLDIAADAGWRPATAQLALTGARPRLGAARLEQMRARVAGLLHVPLDVVAVSASSGNLSGPEGAGRAISASALVTLAVREPAQASDGMPA